MVLQKKSAVVDSLHLIGISVKTENKYEMNPETSQIARLHAMYHGGGLANQIQGRLSPGKTYAVYTRFQDADRGEYTFFLGEVVDHTVEQDSSQFEPFQIAAGHYTQFTTESGPIQQVVCQAWQDIWGMSEDELGGARSFVTDFECYDSRAADPTQAIVDVFIGINQR